MPILSHMIDGDTERHLSPRGNQGKLKRVEPVVEVIAKRSLSRYVRVPQYFLLRISHFFFNHVGKTNDITHVFELSFKPTWSKNPCPSRVFPDYIAIRNDLVLQCRRPDPTLWQISDCHNYNR